MASVIRVAEDECGTIPGELVLSMVLSYLRGLFYETSQVVYFISC